jgi:hypothetical protein
VAVERREKARRGAPAGFEALRQPAEWIPPTGLGLLQFGREGERAMFQISLQRRWPTTRIGKYTWISWNVCEAYAMWGFIYAIHNPIGVC